MLESPLPFQHLISDNSCPVNNVGIVYWAVFIEGVVALLSEMVGGGISSAQRSRVQRIAFGNIRTSGGTSKVDDAVNEPPGAIVRKMGCYWTENQRVP